MTACHEPGNGRPVCIKDEDFATLYDAARRISSRQDTFDEAVGTLVAESSATRKDTRETRKLVESVLVPEVQRLSLLVGSAVPPAGMYGAVIRLANERMDNPAARPKLETFDDEVTNVNRSYLAELKALEMARASTKKVEVEKWKVIAAGVTSAVVAAASALTAYLAAKGG